MIKNILIILALLYGVTCNAEETKSFNELWDIASKKSNTGYPSNAEMQELYHDEYKRVDKILNVVYKKALQSLKGCENEKVEKENFRKSQRHWVKYKEAECYVQSYPYRNGTGEYTMIAPCLIELTEIRTRLLKKHFLFEKN